MTKRPLSLSKTLQHLDATFLASLRLPAFRLTYSPVSRRPTPCRPSTLRHCPAHRPPGVGPQWVHSSALPRPRHRAGTAAWESPRSGGRAAGAWQLPGRASPQRSSPTPPMPMRRAADGVGMGKAAWRMYTVYGW